MCVRLQVREITQTTYQLVDFRWSASGLCALQEVSACARAHTHTRTGGRVGVGATVRNEQSVRGTRTASDHHAA
jgi:hypothetical protein